MDESRPEGVEEVTASEVSGTIPSSLDAEEYRDRIAMAHPASGPGRVEAGPNHSGELNGYPIWGLAISIVLLVQNGYRGLFVIGFLEDSAYWYRVRGLSDAIVSVLHWEYEAGWVLLLPLIASLPATARALRKTDAQPSTAMRVYTVVVYAVCCAFISFYGLGVSVAWSFYPDPCWPWVLVAWLLLGFGVVGTVVFTIRIARLALRLLRARSSRRVP